MSLFKSVKKIVEDVSGRTAQKERKKQLKVLEQEEAKLLKKKKDVQSQAIKSLKRRKSSLFDFVSEDNKKQKLG